MTAWDYALWISLVAVAWLVGKGAGYFKGYAAGKADADETRIVLTVSGQSIGSLGLSGMSIHPGTKIRMEDT
jgi:hypothetical protein